MAELNVTIKSDLPIGSGTRFLAKNIGTSIDVPNNITFKNSAGALAAINRIMVEADGTVEARPFGGADGDKYTQNFVKGGWHRVEPIGYIYGDDGATDTGLGIRVRWED